MLVRPDTSPRNTGTAEADLGWDFGTAAGPRVRGTDAAVRSQHRITCAKVGHVHRAASRSTPFIVDGHLCGAADVRLSEEDHPLRRKCLDSCGQLYAGRRDRAT